MQTNDKEFSRQVEFFFLVGGSREKKKRETQCVLRISHLVIDRELVCVCVTAAAAVITQHGKVN